MMNDSKLKICEIAEMVNLLRKCIYNFTRRMGHEKGFLLMGAAFAHNGTKATMD